MNKVVCVHCERDRPVNLDGKVRKHLNPATGSVCQGSGKHESRFPLAPRSRPQAVAS